MDKIAIIADIHGNLTALETVLSDIKSRGITHIYCLGDIAIKGVSPNEVTNLIRKNCEVVVRGNCDHYWLITVLLNYKNGQLNI